MASLLSISVLFLLFLSLSPATSHEPQSKSPSPTSAATSAPGIIQQACKATPFPQQCQTFLTQSKQLQPNSCPINLIQNAIRVSSDNLKIAHSMVKSILDSAAGNENLTKAANLCLESLGRSQYRISQAEAACPLGKIKDARAWMSAVLSYQSGCSSNFKDINHAEMVVKTLSFLDSANEFSSNALSLLMSYDNFGDNMVKWTTAKTERDGFWESEKHEDLQMGSSGGFPLNLTPNVTVCKDGSNGSYKTVQEAVNAAPNNLDGGKKFVIGIKEGVYEEKVRIPLEKKNVVFLGDGMGKTVITWNANAGQPGITTFESATVGVLGDGFMAKGVTFQNTAGPAKIQAVAFRTDSDKSVMENCEFLGHQDTLYVHSLRQFFKACRIEGNVDFIFGNSAAFFQDCEILIRPRQINPENEEKNAITAQSRGNPLETTGYVFQNCLINGTEDYMKLYHSNPQVRHNFLGRPWRNFARTVFINCTMEDLIAPQGWSPMTANSTLNTVYYGEFNNTGPGSNTSGRVPWSNRIPIEHVLTFSVTNFIQGNDWIPILEQAQSNSKYNFGAFYSRKINGIH